MPASAFGSAAAADDAAAAGALVLAYWN